MAWLFGKWKPEPKPGIDNIKEEYPQFKVNEDGEIFKIEKDYFICVLTDDAEFINFKSDITEKTNMTTDWWKPIPYNKERGLYHKQPVWCWDEEDCSARIIRFYDVVNDCTFKYDGYSGGILFDNIEPITPEQLKTMPFLWEMCKQLKG